MNIGDRIVYPMHGAGTITGIEECEVLGEDKSYYVLRMPMKNMKVMIPVDNVENLGLRQVIPAEKIAEVHDILSEKPDRAMGSWNKRFHANLDRMKNGDLREAAAVARNLMVQDQKHRISSGERRLLDLAKQIVVSEVSYACNKSTDEVETWMEDLVFHRKKKN